MSKMIYAGSVGTPASVGKAQKGSIGGNGEGVYSLLLNEDYSLLKKDACPVDNGGIICRSKDGKYVYCANESRNFDHGFNGSGGGITAFKVNDTGMLEKLNDSISYGSRTSYVNVTEDNQYLVCSNHGSHTTVTCHYTLNEDGQYVLERGYDDSSVALFKLNEDGSIGPLCDLQVFKGNGYWIYGGGQSTSHVHCVKTKNDIVISCNRGADEIEVMRIDRENNKLIVLSKLKTKKGLAPRHLDFHPEKSLIYVAFENYPCVGVFQLNNENGTLSELQMIQAADEAYLEENPLPVFTKEHCDYGEENTSAMGDFSRKMPSDIHVSSDGKYLYASVRRMKQYQASIVTYQVQEDGTLKLLQDYPLDGGDPRGFNLIDDNHLIVGLCDKNKVVIYQLCNGLIDKKLYECEVNSTASFAIGD